MRANSRKSLGDSDSCTREIPKESRCWTKVFRLSDTAATFNFDHYHLTIIYSLPFFFKAKPNSLPYIYAYVRHVTIINIYMYLTTKP